MTWRAFIIGLLFAAGIALLEPWVSWAKGWGGFSGNAFPAGAMMVLVVLTLGLNVILKLARRGWELSQAELMLVYCMLIVAATFPGDGLARFWFSFTAAPPYLAERPDVYWEEDGALTYAPEALVLSKRPGDVAARRYFEGRSPGVPWSRWARPLAHWAVFFVLLYLAVFFLFAILRRQWAESERLMFPLARVPLEFTEEAAGRGLLPRLFSEKGFMAGLIFSLGFRLFRALPLFFGADSGISISIPFHDMFLGTPLEPMGFANVDLWYSAVGFAYLVPADVSLSIWFFYFFARAELQTAHWLGYGHLGGALMAWQQAGAYIAFTVGVLFMARRHLWAVAGKALGLKRMDDAREPVPYRFAFYGLVLSVAGCLAWYVYHGMRLSTAVLVFAMIMCWYMVYARVVAQAGLYVARTTWRMPEFVHGITGGRLMGPQGAVIAALQDPLLVTGGTCYLAPIAANAFRIAEVFRERWRRLLVPALMAAFLVSMACGTWTSLRTAYSMGGANYSDWWGQTAEVRWRLDAAQAVIKQPSQSAEGRPGFLLMGLAGMGVMMFMRARFYWWPVHAIGLLSCASWHANRLWLPFLLGWTIKVGIMKFSGGRLLRDARYFFIALIAVEAFVGGVSTLVRTISGGTVAGF